MAERCTTVAFENPSDAMWEVIGGGIHEYNIRQAGGSQEQRICVALHAQDQTVAGGLIGETHWGWFYIDLLVVREDLRGQGYGHRHLTLAEEQARQRGATHA